MDQRQLAELRRWATRLQDSSPNEELRAAGKAILMLTEEIAQLNLRLEAAASREEDLPASLDDEEADTEHGARAWFRRTLGISPDEELEA